MIELAGAVVGVGVWSVHASRDRCVASNRLAASGELMQGI